jgi:hypothetical protein
MTFTKSLLTAVSALTLATGAAFAGEDSTHRWHGTGAEYHEAGGLQAFSDAEAVGSENFSDAMPVSSLETTDAAYFAQSELTMTDPMTLSSTGSSIESGDVYYIVPMEVVEVEEIWLIPSGDSAMPQG